MLRYSIIDAPSILGLRPTGVEGLPEALKKAGLMDKLNAIYAVVFNHYFRIIQNVILQPLS